MLCTLLFPLSWLYGAVLKARSFLYLEGFFKRSRAKVPVISIGNLSFGGTGKTPLTIWVTRFLTERKKKVGVLSRGYAGGPQGNDEAAILKDLLPGLIHVENPNRIQAAKELVEKQKVELIVLDDGFQHLRLLRDLDLLLIDATDPFGGDFCPPSGRLRETLSAIRRADLVILTRADLVSGEEKEKIWAQIHHYLPTAPRIELAFEPVSIWITKTGEKKPVSILKDQELILLSAIGNPTAFRLSAEKLGARVRNDSRFRDHHFFSGLTLQSVMRDNNPDELPVLCTHKDWVKIREYRNFFPWVLEIEARFLRGQEIVEQRLSQLVSPEKQAG